MKARMNEQSSVDASVEASSRRLIADVLDRGSNNLDLVRLIAACAVIFGHAYALIPQHSGDDPFKKILPYDYSGSLAVKVFFFISGLVIVHSVIRAPALFPFLFKRAIRIVPALIACNLITVFVIGLALTQIPLLEYISSKEIYTYIIRNTFLYDIQWRLPGVFESSRYGVNGSLWTLPWELLCYFGVAIGVVLSVFVSRPFASVVAGALLAGYLLFPEAVGAPPLTSEAYWLLPSFLIGALFALLADRLPLRFETVILGWLFYYLAQHTAVSQLIFYSATFYSLIFVFSIPIIVRRVPVPLDISFGVYLYGFPVQQSLYHLFPDSSVTQNQLAALSIAIALGTASALFVERPVIGWGREILRRRGIILARFRAWIADLQSLRLQPEGGWMEVLGVLALAALVYAAALKFVFPGYFSPFWPHHSDFFMANQLAANPVEALKYLSWSRPIGTYLYALIGNAPMRVTIGIIVLITLLNAALSVVIFRRLLGVSNALAFMASAAMYFFVLFTAPGFYIFYSHDGMAQLSFLLLLLAGFGFASLRNRHAGAAALVLFVGAACAFLTKETYVLTSLGVAFAFLVLSDWRDWRWRLLPGVALAGAALVAAGLALRVKSAFIGQAGTDAYRVDLSPWSVASEWWQYASTGVNAALACALAILLLAGWWDRRSQKGRPAFWMAFAAMGAGALAWVPNATLPYHFFVGYSWNGAYLFFLPILLLATFEQRRLAWRISAAAVAVLLLANPVLNRAAYASGGWVLQNEAMLKNLWRSLGRQIDALPAGRPSRVLITGLAAPFSPFDFPRSLEERIKGKPVSISVVAYQQRPASNGWDLPFVPLLEQVPDGYDEFWLMRRDGRLIRALAPADLANLPLPQGTTLVQSLNFPELLGVDSALATPCMLAGVIMGYEVVTEAEDAVARCVAAEPSNPYGWFWKGKLALAQGDNVAAADAFRQAVRFDDRQQPNVWFARLLRQAEAAAAPAN